MQFTSSTGVTSERTAIVRFYSDADKITRSQKFGFIEVATIYDSINNGDDILLDDFFVHNFSLVDYRKTFKIDDHELVELKSFSAARAFFDCDDNINFSGAHVINNGYNFSHTHFGDGNIDFDRSKIDNGTIDFSHTVFGLGNVSFQFIDFGNGDVNFQRAVFNNGKLSFVNAQFGNGNINFKEVNFGGGSVDFLFAKIGEGDICFDKANFGSNEVDFRKVEFGKGKVDFKRVLFGTGNVNFEEAEFGSGKISFRSCDFKGSNMSFENVDFGDNEVIFDRSSFGEGNVSFRNTSFNKLSFKECHIDNYLDIRVNCGNIIDLSDTIVRDIIDVMPVKYTVKIDQLIFKGMRNLGRIYIGWKENDAKKLITNQVKSSFMEKAEQFRILKGEFSAMGRYDDEDEAYVEFKRYELRAHIDEANNAGGLKIITIYPLAFFQWLIFDKVGLYATNFMRVMLSMFVVFTIFSLLYTFLPDSMGMVTCPDSADLLHHRLANNFYFSAITFLTVGYGDCLPSGFFKVLAPLEGWIGVFLMAYFTVAFVRKILR